MKTPHRHRWLAVAAFPALLLLKMTATHAFTDTNAELQGLTHDRAAAAQAVRQLASGPAQTAWVPPSVKSLDGFRPVYRELQPTRAPAQHTVVAQAPTKPPASAPRR